MLNSKIHSVGGPLTKVPLKAGELTEFAAATDTTAASEYAVHW